MTVMTALATAPVWLPFAAQTLIAKQGRRIPKRRAEFPEDNAYGESSGPPELHSLPVDLVNEWAATNGSPETPSP